MEGWLPGSQQHPTGEDCGKWVSHDINPDEEDLILRLHKLLGDRWSLIAGRLPGRTAEEVEKFWKLKKKMKKRSGEEIHESRENDAVMYCEKKSRGVEFDAEIITGGTVKKVDQDSSCEVMSATDRSEVSQPFCNAVLQQSCEMSLDCALRVT